MPEIKRRYPDYDAVWHLVTMGVLTPDHTPNGWQPPAATDRKARVAMIDTSVAVTHPNLAPAINSSLALDFFSTRLGAFPYLDDDKIGALDLNTKTKVTTGLPRSSDLLAELIDRLSHGSPAREGSIRPMTSPEFSNHGTAIAGLIGSRPGIMSETLTTSPGMSGTLRGAARALFTTVISPLGPLSCSQATRMVISLTVLAGGWRSWILRENSPSPVLASMSSAALALTLASICSRPGTFGTGLVRFNSFFLLDREGAAGAESGRKPITRGRLVRQSRWQRLRAAEVNPINILQTVTKKSSRSLIKYPSVYLTSA